MTTTHIHRVGAGLLAALTLATAGACQGPDPAPSPPATTATEPSTPTRTSATTTGAQPSTQSKTAGSTAPRPGSTATPRGLPSEATVDQGNSAAVAAAYARAAWTIDTRIDASHFDAQRRAARWLTPEMAAGLRAPSRGRETGWEELETAGAWTKVTVVNVTPAPGDPTRGLSAVLLEQLTITTYRGDATRLGPTQNVTISLSLSRERHRDPWRVQDVTTY